MIYSSVEGFNTANVISAVASFILFLSLSILPTRLYRELLRPYRHLFVLVALALLNDSIRKFAGVLWMNHYIPFWMLVITSWSTTIISCIAVGFFIPVFRNMGILNYMEEHKRVADLKFRSVFECSPDAIVIADTSSTIIDWNDAASLIFGYTAEEAVGQPLTILMSEEDKARHLQGVARFVSTGEHHILGHTVRLRGVRKSGEVFPIELSLSSYSISSEAYFVAMIRDITLRANLEKENAELKTQNSSA